MRNFISMIILIITFSATAGNNDTVQKQDISELFKSMPSELLPGVSEGNKTMLLVDSGETSVPYALGKITKTGHGSDYLKIKTSEVGTTQLKLLPLRKDSAIVCVIKTVCAEACDSQISFYTTRWEKIESNRFLPEISKDIFFDSSKKKMENYKYAVSLHHIYPIEAKFSESGSDLMLTFHYEPLLTVEQIEAMKPFLISDSVVLKWKNGSFRK